MTDPDDRFVFYVVLFICAGLAGVVGAVLMRDGASVGVAILLAVVMSRLFSLLQSGR